MNSVVVIPSREPDDKLVPYIEKLISAGIKKIIVVNDGSSDKCNDIFSEIESIEQ